MSLVVSRAEALAAGRSVREVDALVRSGRWLALRRAVYLTQPTLPRHPAVRHAVLVAAAVLSSGVPSIGSSTSAAVVHGLPLLVPHTGPPVLTRLRVPGSERPQGRNAARLVAHVPPQHRTVVHGAPVTAVARTAIDLARLGSPLDAVVVLDAALGRAGREALSEVLAVEAGWPGVARARRAVEFADGRSESPLESVGRLRIAELGLPAPELQVLVGDEDGPIGRVDYLWEEHRTVGEADGRLKYVDQAALWFEKQREDRLREAGFEVVRFGWADALHHPEVLRDRLLAAFARTGRRVA